MGNGTIGRGESSRTQDTAQTLDSAKVDKKATKNLNIALRDLAGRAGVPHKTVLAAFSADASELGRLYSNHDRKRLHSHKSLTDLQGHLDSALKSGKPFTKALTQSDVKRALNNISGEIGRRESVAKEPGRGVNTESKYEHQADAAARESHRNIFNKATHKLSKLAEPSKNSLALFGLKTSKQTGKAADRAGELAKEGYEGAKKAGGRVIRDVGTIAETGYDTARYVGDQVGEGAKYLGDKAGKSAKAGFEAGLAGGVFVGKKTGKIAASVAESVVRGANSIAKKGRDAASIKWSSGNRDLRHFDQENFFKEFNPQSKNPDRKTIKKWIEGKLSNIKLPRGLSKDSDFKAIEPYLREYLGSVGRES